MLFSPSLQPPIPISSKTRALFMTPMEDGLRIAGTVEIAGLDAPPEERRAMILIDHARRLYPALKAGDVRYWTGVRPSTPDSLPILGR
jgi:glycine/D-amino acid oxidase-like deaminating enzyme